MHLKVWRMTLFYHNAQKQEETTLISQYPESQTIRIVLSSLSCPATGGLRLEAAALTLDEETRWGLLADVGRGDLGEGRAVLSSQAPSPTILTALWQSGGLLSCRVWLKDFNSWRERVSVTALKFNSFPFFSFKLHERLLPHEIPPKQIKQLERT